MKFTQKKCRIKLPTTKSANALRLVSNPMNGHLAECTIPLVTDIPMKLLLILRVRLDPQSSRQNKLSNRGRESSQEGIERLHNNDI